MTYIHPTAFDNFNAVCSVFYSVKFTELLHSPFHLWVDTHGLGVHKAASGACCYAAHSQGPRHGIGPLAGRCRCPRTLPCCTSGTDKSLPHRCGLRWLVWKGRRAEVGGIIHNVSSFYFTGFILICVAWGNCIMRTCHRQCLGIRECIVLQKKGKQFPTLDCHSRVCETLLLHHRCESTVQTHSMSPSFHLALLCQGSARCSGL